MANPNPSKRTSRPVGSTAQALAANLREIRKQRGIDIADLTRVLGENGYPISASAISKIENGRQRADVDMLVALSVALNVSPLRLLLPVDVAPDEKVDITGAPGPIFSSLLWQWALGRIPLHVFGAPEGGSVYRRSTLPVWIVEGDEKQQHRLEFLQEFYDKTTTVEHGAGLDH